VSSAWTQQLIPVPAGEWKDLGLTSPRGVRSASFLTLGIYLRRQQFEPIFRLLTEFYSATAAEIRSLCRVSICPNLSVDTATFHTPFSPSAENDVGDCHLFPSIP